ncbi:MAG: hypothetical protein HC895_01425 [Leptolyngbyaceae cyanobacterium SM1_3_5]|nr:hypothetical protein [Leptolyngbyaceae cyanobacterium SM1_3_5]
MIAPRFGFAINPHGCNKNWDFARLNSQFQDREGTLEDLIHHIRQGHALCAGLLGDKQRSKANFIGSNWLLVDIDNSTLARDENGQVIKTRTATASKFTSIR